MISASLVPCSEADTIGTTTPISTLSSSPKLTKNDVTVMSRSRARRSAITSFSCAGTPYGVQLEPTRLSRSEERRVGKECRSRWPAEREIEKRELQLRTGTELLDV